MKEKVLIKQLQNYRRELYAKYSEIDVKQNAAILHTHCMSDFNDL